MAGVFVVFCQEDITMLQRLILIALAGALGTLARYGLGGVVQRLSAEGLPVGTLVVNVLGCFLFGLVWTLSAERLMISEDSRVIMLGGFMGAFTTFSTFIFDTGGFLRNEQYLMATGNILAQTIIGLLSFFAGIAIGRLG
jgi:CrcB protein